MKNKMLAYHGDPVIKAKYISRMKAHMAADELIRGTGWEGGKGCAVGCTLNNYDHNAYPQELGVPVQLAQLEDAIFEGLPKEEAMKFPLQFLEAIEPGADLSLVWPRFAVWLLTDQVHGTLQYCDEQGKNATKQVAELFNQTIAGNQPSDAARDAAWAAARDAARDAAWAAASDAAWDAARDAAWDAAWAAASDAASDAAWDAAWAAASDAAWAAASAAARDAHYILQRDKLLELMAACRKEAPNA